MGIYSYINISIIYDIFYIMFNRWRQNKSCAPVPLVNEAVRGASFWSGTIESALDRSADFAIDYVSNSGLRCHLVIPKSGLDARLQQEVRESVGKGIEVVLSGGDLRRVLINDQLVLKR
jgi:hypothetical protein